VKQLVLFGAAWLAAGAAFAQTPAPLAPIVVSGTVADEASKSALLARVRQVFGPERVLDQLHVAKVSAPDNWNDYVGKLIGPNLKLVSHGQLKVVGSAVSLRGDVASEALRQQVGSGIGANPNYTVSNDLRVAASQQLRVDSMLEKRSVEFESGKATLTEAGRAILDEIGLILLEVKEKKIELIGHTDNAGARATNLALSQERAGAVKVYLAAKGIKPDNIAVSGEGPDRPVGDNRTADGRARNRRIEFKIVQERRRPQSSGQVDGHLRRAGRHASG
jgi:OOP family OmpA-OmpF porin